MNSTSNPNPTPILAVIGATGAQGGGLAQALLARTRPTFRLRALTRRPHAAAALAAAGAEVMAADLDDLPSLQRAFTGVHGVFAVTNYWEHHSPAREQQQARHIAQAARQAGVQHLVWSTLEDTRQLSPVEDLRLPMLPGGYKVPHMDGKAACDGYFTELGVPTTFLRTSFYWDNLLHLGMGPVRAADGGLELVLPIGERKLPGIAAADIGACALALFEQGPSAIGQTVGVAGQHLGGQAMAATLAQVLGESVRFRALSFAELAEQGFPGAADLAHMFQYKHDFNAAVCALRPVAATAALHPGLLDFAAWAAHHADALRRSVAPARPPVPDSAPTPHLELSGDHA